MWQKKNRASAYSGKMVREDTNQGEGIILTGFAFIRKFRYFNEQHPWVYTASNSQTAAMPMLGTIKNLIYYRWAL